MNGLPTRQLSEVATLFTGRGARLIESLYGEARLQPAQPSFVTRSRTYGLFRLWVSDRGLEANTIAAIKAFHSGAFLVLGGSLLHVTYSCVRGRISHRTWISIVAVAGESAVIIANSGRCPLTSVVEDLGSEHGSVSDIFLPDWVARNIPHVSSALLGVAIISLAVRRMLKERA
jgi:hypothetical protein